MSKTQRVLLVAGVIALAVVVLPVVTQATHSWNNYHWARTSNPFTIKLGDNVSSTWDSYLATTSSDWSLSSVLDTVIVDGSTRPRSCKAKSGQGEVCSAKYGNTGWLGIASIYLTSGSHISAGTVKVNDTYFNTSTYNTPAWRNLVMCQEVGHIFGLDHQDENFNNPPLGTCMDYSSNPEPNQHPNAHDYEQLELIYEHVDDFTSVAASRVGISPQAMYDLDLAGPGQWGQLVDMSPDGRTSTFRLDFGHGNQIITFVIWVDAEDFVPGPDVRN